jgi:hypothetical protein
LDSSAVSDIVDAAGELAPSRTTFSQVESLVRDNRVEVRVLFGA